MTNRQLLLQIIDCAFDKQSWHGANLMSALRGVSAKRAAKSLPGRRSIWQQALHAAYWKHAILNKLAGTTRFGRPGSNWPKLPSVISDKTWRADLEFLGDEHRQLRSAINSLPERGLSTKTIWYIHGAAAHDLYHAGQIKLLRRLIDGE
jgi:hypothetical protein